MREGARVGLARAHSDANPQEIAGTQPYLPPEVLTGTPLPTPMRYLWAAGVMLDELLRGRRPYPNGVFKWKPPPVLPIEVLPLVRAIVDKALSEKPEDRYQTAAEMLEAVAQAQRRTRRLSGPSAAIAVKVAKKERSRRWMVGAAATLVTSVVVGVYSLVFAERVPIASTDFSVPTRLHIEAMDLGHRIRNEIVTDVNPRVSGCQARALGRGFGGRGTLALSFTVRPNGSVADMNVGGTVPMDDVLRRCFVRTVGQRQFDNWMHEETIAMADYEIMTPPAAPHRTQAP